MHATKVGARPSWIYYRRLQRKTRVTPRWQALRDVLAGAADDRPPWQTCRGAAVAVTGRIAARHGLANGLLEATGMRSLACVVVAFLAACGGGGSSGAAPDAPAPDAPPPDAGSAACAAPTVSFSHTAGTSGVAHYHKVNTTVAAHKAAVCNDGSPGVYTVRAGYGGGAHRWVIFLEGGGSCQTADECNARGMSLMSSNAITDGAINATVFDAIRSSNATDNPDFYDANFVQIEYCSSDGWTGAAAAQNVDASNVHHWAFQGRAIIAAVIDELSTYGLAAGDEVLLTGGSAGGVGVYNNVDDVRALLPASIRLVALADAGFILDYPALDPDTMQESTDAPTLIEAGAIEAAGVWSGHGNTRCEAAATTDTERAACRGGAAMLGGSYVQTPMLVRQSQLDHVQLDRLIPADLVSQHGGAVDAYRGRFAARMRDVLGALPLATSPHYAEFSTFDQQHVMITGPAWKTITVDGTALSDAIGAFYQAPCDAPRRVETP